jgi:hypothetical protein
VSDATLSDAILDRLVHNAYRINLKGESMRKHQAKIDTIWRFRVTKRYQRRFAPTARPDQRGMRGRMAWNTHSAFNLISMVANANRIPNS